MYSIVFICHMYFPMLCLSRMLTLSEWCFRVGHSKNAIVLCIVRVFFIGFNTSEKYSSRGIIIPNIWEQMFQTTNQKITFWILSDREPGLQTTFVPQRAVTGLAKPLQLSWITLDQKDGRKEKHKIFGQPDMVPKTHSKLKSRHAIGTNKNSEMPLPNKLHGSTGKMVAFCWRAVCEVLGIQCSNWLRDV